MIKVFYVDDLVFYRKRRFHVQQALAGPHSGASELGPTINLKKKNRGNEI